MAYLQTHEHKKLLPSNYLTYNIQSNFYTSI